MWTKKFHYVSVLVLFAGWYMSSDDSKISTDAIGDVNEYLLSPTKGGALKVTIPDDLNDDLSAYAAGYNTSKSEVVRNSVASFMGNDLRWTHRQYFFRPRRKLVSFEILECVLALFKSLVFQNIFQGMPLELQLSYLNMRKIFRL